MLRSMSSAELSEWMAYFTMLSEDSQPGRFTPTQSASGDEAIAVLRKHARKRH